MKKKATLAALVLGVIAAVMLPSTPASAAPGEVVVAVATGNTTAAAPNIDILQNASCGTGSFDDVQMAGVFADANGQFAGTISTGTVPFTTCQTLLRGSGTIGAAAFSGSGVVGTLCGAGIADGDFVRAGTVAVAMFTLNYDAGCNGSGAVNLLTTAVVAAVPVGTTGQAVIAGPVVGF